MKSRCCCTGSSLVTFILYVRISKGHSYASPSVCQMTRCFLIVFILLMRRRLDTSGVLLCSGSICLVDSIPSISTQNVRPCAKKRSLFCYPLHANNHIPSG